jgi:FKBP-type peptidyl-prolyl cis-trans isomerase
MDQDAEDDAVDDVLAVQNDGDEKAAIANFTRLCESKTTSEAGLAEAEIALSNQATDPLDPDYDAGTISELKHQIEGFTDRIDALEQRIQETELMAIVHIQMLWRTREARKGFHGMLQKMYEKVYDHNAGAYFYYNKKDGTTSWDPPAALKSDPFGDDIEKVTEFGRPSGWDPETAAEEERIQRVRELKLLEAEKLAHKAALRVEDWNTDDVVEWFEAVTLAQFGYRWKDSVLEALYTNEINGAVLTAMDEADWREIGVTSGLHIKRMQVKLGRLKRHEERDARHNALRALGQEVEDYSSSSAEEYDDSDIDDDDSDADGSDDEEGSDSDDDLDAELTENEIAQLKKDEENLSIEILFAGDEERYPQKGDIVRIHYECSRTSDGQVIENSREREGAFEFILGTGQVIQGMDRGIQKMSFGERANITVKARYAYGSMGLPPSIPAHSTLKFDVELISWRTPPIWEKPMIMAEDDLMESDKDHFFWMPESLEKGDPDLHNYDSD